MAETREPDWPAGVLTLVNMRVSRMDTPRRCECSTGTQQTVKARLYRHISRITIWRPGARATPTSSKLLWGNPVTLHIHTRTHIQTHTYTHIHTLYLYTKRTSHVITLHAANDLGKTNYITLHTHTDKHTHTHI